jgi:hypothetical protein
MDSSYSLPLGASPRRRQLPPIQSLQLHFVAFVTRWIERPALNDNCSCSMLFLINWRLLLCLIVRERTRSVHCISRLCRHTLHNSDMSRLVTKWKLHGAPKLTLEVLSNLEIFWYEKVCVGGENSSKKSWFRRYLTRLGLGAVSTLRTVDCFREFLVQSGVGREPPRTA